MVICLLLFLASLSLGSIHSAQPLILTREIVPTNVRIEELRAQSSLSNNALEIFLDSLIQNQNQTILTLMEKIETNKTDLGGIFNVVNQGFGADLFKVDNGLLKIELSQIEVFATSQIKFFANALFPKDLLRRMSFSAVAIADVISIIRSSATELESIGLPLEEVSDAFDLLPRNEVVISTRSSSSITKILLALYKSQICSAFSDIYSNVNSTAYTIMEYLNGTTIETSSITNTAIAILANFYNTLVETLDELIEYGLELVESVYESASCSSSSRRRRDLSNQNTELVSTHQLHPRAVMKRSVTILSIIGTIIAFIYKYTLGKVLATLLKSYVSKVSTYVQGVVDTFINNTTTWLYSLISNITLSS